ncbi:MAG: hypothetical protein KAW45_05985 [Thermoplasmatales archaeon]|nr:hypothetical protein [Thermoplasmatales archaeon]
MRLGIVQRNSAKQDVVIEKIENVTGLWALDTLHLSMRTNYGIFYNYLDSSGARVVPDLVADLNVDWLGNAQLDISFNIENNEAIAYPGHLRVYVTELESTLWNDQQGNPFYHAFLDFAFDQAINIPAEDTYSDSAVWDGVVAGYPEISGNNIQVILAVFDDTPHQSYSDPPSDAPFWAYYVDETVAARIPNNPPDAPDIDGPPSGTAGNSYEYTFTAVDPDGDDVSYYIKWGDGDVTDWTAFQASGPPGYSESHTWSAQDTYTIEAKAKDTYGAESDWETLEVTIPRNRMVTNPLILQFLEKFPHTFSILRYILKTISLQ